MKRLASLIYVFGLTATCLGLWSKLAVAEPMRLRVLTYNIHHGAGLDGRVDLNRIAQVIKAAEPDLVALQEVDQRVPRSGNVGQAAELARLTGMQAVFGSNLDYQGGQYGNAVLSRLPILEHRNVLLPKLEDGEQRGVLVTQVELPNRQPLVLFATHLDHRSAADRLAAVRRINELSGNFADSPLLLAGDLNAEPGSPPLVELAQIWKLANEHPLTTSPADPPRSQIDFVLFAAEDWQVVDVQVLDENVASDHRPLLAVLEAPAVKSPVATSASQESRHQSPRRDASKRYLIIHADDAGMSHSANEGTIEGLEQGVVSSASIMVPCPWFSEFAEYCRQHPEGDYGIHLTLNSEWEHYRWGPVAPREQVPSLVDPDGYLWDNVAQVRQHVRVEEAAIELRAQIERAKQFGIPLSHLDTHMGAVISRPDLLQLYVQLGLEYDLPILFLDVEKSGIAEEYPAFVEQGSELQQQLIDQRLPILDQVAQFYGGDSHSQRRETYLNFLRSLSPGYSQLIIHCGFDNSEMQAITSSSARRDGDRRVFTDPAVVDLIQDLEIEVITWGQMRDLQYPGD